MTSLYDRLRERGGFSALDVHFARRICELGAEPRAEAALGAALASRQTRAGHVCVDLTSFAGRDIVELEDGGAQAPTPDTRWPELEPWQRVLSSSPVVGDGSTPTPLVLRGGSRLYLYRYWEHERRIAEALDARARRHVPLSDATRVVEALDRLFPDDGLGATQQRLAAELALIGQLCVVSGGPGTGKTSLVVKLLAALIGSILERGDAPPRTVLLAPTGKAAARLVEAVKRAKDTLAVPDSVRDAIPERASTIHRALLFGRGGRQQTLDSIRLEAELLVVDECSMVDVALMRRLLDAVGQHARLILLGDKNQLASVEAGAVFADICESPVGGGGEPELRGELAERYRAAFGRPPPGKVARKALPPIADSVQRLSHSYRFAGDSGIGRLARATEQGNWAAAVELLESSGTGDVVRVDPADPDYMAKLRAAIGAGYADVVRARSPQQALGALEKFRVLAAHRRGRWGVERLNALAEQALLRAGLISGAGEWYAGRPLLVVENDYQLELFNGDVGVILPEAAEGHVPRAYFVGPSGEERVLSPARLPAHETVFAMSIHKSQGSEFDEVLIVLPDESSRLLTRELFYTAITRARRKVTIYGSLPAIRTAIERRVERASGLGEALWGGRE